MPGTGSVSLAVSPFGALDAPAVLQALDRYPYGCSEQTVSRAMPLLYANQLASAEHLAIDPDLDGRIKGGDRQGDDAAELQRRVRPVGGRQRRRRSLARRLRHRFPHPRPRTHLRRAAAGFDNALDHLRNEVVNAADPGEGAGEPLAYALYVLARNGRPVIGDLRYLADTKLDVFKTPLAQAQIAAALAMLGDRARAGKVFGAALDALEAEKDTGLSRPDYGSRLRDAAACWRCSPKRI